MEEIQRVIHENKKGNSYEFGKAGNRFKIYYSDIEDLKKQIKELRDAGLIENEEPTKE